MIFEARILGGMASEAVLPSGGEHRFGGRLDRGDIAGMDFEIAELPLHHQDAALDVGFLQRDVGEGFDIEPRGNLDDLRRHVAAGQGAFDPRAQIAHGLRLQLVEEDEGAECCHGLGRENRVQLLENDLAKFTAQFIGVRIARPPADGAGFAAFGRFSGSRPVKLPKAFAGLLVVGNARVLHEMVRREVFTERGAAGKARADGHRGAEIGLIARGAKRAAGIDRDAQRRKGCGESQDIGLVL